MVNNTISNKMLETLANKEKSSQIAARNFFRTCFFDENMGVDSDFHIIL